MTKKNIYSYTDYKTYLLALEASKIFKGFRARIAECTNCQNAFVSQVLNGHVNFNLEQSIRMGALFSLDKDELQYFLWMVECKRAGTLELRKYFLGLMDVLREKNLKIHKRVQIPQVLTSEAQTTYYSSWIYSAVHVAVMIPKLNTIEKISKALDLSNEVCVEVVKFLLKNGLLLQVGSTLKSGQVQIHLNNESPNINKHHSNWRIEALKSLDQPSTSDLHYSGVSSLSKNDVEKIQMMFIEVIENYVRLVEKSPEETLYAFNLDFFQMMINEK